MSSASLHMHLKFPNRFQTFKYLQYQPKLSLELHLLLNAYSITCSVVSKLHQQYATINRTTGQKYARRLQFS